MWEAPLCFAMKTTEVTQVVKTRFKTILWKIKIAFSEPETQAIKNFVETYKKSIKIALNFHAYSFIFHLLYNLRKVMAIFG